MGRNLIFLAVNKVKKELGIAIFIGALLGFGISGLFWATKKGKLSLTGLKNQPTPTESIDVSTTTVPTETEQEKISLTITEPENEIIHSKENITIKGKTLANATVVIIWEEGEDILVASNNGQFETEISLVGGENVIDITAYNDQGDKTTKTLTITYSTAKF